MLEYLQLLLSNSDAFTLDVYFRGPRSCAEDATLFQCDATGIVVVWVENGKGGIHLVPWSAISWIDVEMT